MSLVHLHSSQTSTPTGIHTEVEGRKGGDRRIILVTRNNMISSIGLRRDEPTMSLTGERIENFIQTNQREIFLSGSLGRRRQGVTVDSLCWYLYII